MAIIEHKKGRAKKKQAGFHDGQKVELLISARNQMGFSAVINGTHKGMLYKNEIFQPLKIGQEIDGFIKKVRDDKKIDRVLSANLSRRKKMQFFLREGCHGAYGAWHSRFKIDY